VISQTIRRHALSLTRLHTDATSLKVYRVDACNADEEGLAERGETLLDRAAPSQHPTARTVFHLMRHMAVVTPQSAGQARRHVTTLNAHQLYVIRLLGDEPSIYALPRRKSA
jgi:hypothetical protein